MQKNILSRLGLTLCVALFSFSSSKAQDIIVKTDGDSIPAKVLKIKPSVIEYKKWSNPDGPTYETPVAEIRLIRYSNGEKDVFNPAVTLPPVAASAATENDAAISRYNSAAYTFRPKKMKGKNAGSAIGILGITPGSIMSGYDLSIRLMQVENDIILLAEPGNVQNDHDTVFGGRYLLELTNNTDRTLYIDKASTTRIEADGKRIVYHDTTRHDSKDERVLVLAPHATAPLTRDKGSLIKGTTKVLVDQKSEYYESFPPHMVQGLKDGEKRTGDPETDARRYVIAYSDDPELSALKGLEFGVYVRECLGFRYSNDTNLSPFNGEWKDLFRRRYISFGMKYDKFLKKHFDSKEPDAIIVIHSWIEN